jgi:hypothetical protein
LRSGRRYRIVGVRRLNVFVDDRNDYLDGWNRKRRDKKDLKGSALDPEDKEDDAQWIAKVNAILRRYYQINPEDLSNQEWSKLFNEWVYLEKQKLDNFETIIKNAVFEVAKAVMGSN